MRFFSTFFLDQSARSFPTRIDHWKTEDSFHFLSVAERGAWSEWGDCSACYGQKYRGGPQWNEKMAPLFAGEKNFGVQGFPRLCFWAFRGLQKVMPLHILENKAMDPSSHPKKHKHNRPEAEADFCWGARIIAHLQWLGFWPQRVLWSHRESLRIPSGADLFHSPTYTKTDRKTQTHKKKKKHRNWFCFHITPTKKPTEKPTQSNPSLRFRFARNECGRKCEPGAAKVGRLFLWIDLVRVPGSFEVLRRFLVEIDHSLVVFFVVPQNDLNPPSLFIFFCADTGWCFHLLKTTTTTGLLGTTVPVDIFFGKASNYQLDHQQFAVLVASTRQETMNCTGACEEEDSLVRWRRGGPCMSFFSPLFFTTKMSESLKIYAKSWILERFIIIYLLLKGHFSQVFCNVTFAASLSTTAVGPSGVTWVVRAPGGVLEVLILLLFFCCPIVIELWLVTVIVC